MESFIYYSAALTQKKIKQQGGTENGNKCRNNVFRKGKTIELV